jgi:hypothetical protein
MTRRDALFQLTNGFGAIGLAGLLQAEPASLAPRAPHFAPKAKQVIFLFLNGGPSQVDTFDPKPSLAKYHGQPMPGNSKTAKQERGTLMQSPFSFKQYGQSGLPVSELFAKTAAAHADDLCVIRSMHTDLPAHQQAILQMNSGRVIPGFPSWGAWTTYGLGSENRNLPGYIALCAGVPDVGPQVWSSAFLPAAYQGTYVPADESDPEKMIQHIRDRSGSPADQRRRVDLWRKLNQMDLAARGADPQLEGRIQSMEIAYRMQSEALEAFDISKEPAAVRARYGADQTESGEMHIKSATRDGDFARGCLVARRLIERGVRAVQVYFGNDKPWDSHHDILVHRRLARQADQPIAALLSDLKASGLLKETLVIIGGEFGRRPWTEVAGRINVQNGRNHNNEGFTTVLAGGGVKGGLAYGATDEFGYQAVENKVHVHDLHATVLHLLGLDHTRLTYQYSGRQFRLTDTAGIVVKDILA